MTRDVSDSGSSGQPINVPWNDLVRFVRQLSHDLRNQLNAAELHAAYIAELVDDVELKSEIKKMREMISELGGILQKLTGKLNPIKPDVMPYQGLEFVEDLRKRIAHDFANESPSIEWDVQIGDVILDIDPVLLQEVLVELFANAFQHERGKGAVVASAKAEDGHFVFTLREPKASFEPSTENWGREPLRKVRQGHYGLGLNRMRVVVEAHGGKLRAHYDPTASALITTISLPIAPKRG
jgi:signal transduction histidine kinase